MTNALKQWIKYGQPDTDILRFEYITHLNSIDIVMATSFDILLNSKVVIYMWFSECLYDNTYNLMPK